MRKQLLQQLLRLLARHTARTHVNSRPCTETVATTDYAHYLSREHEFRPVISDEAFLVRPFQHAEQLVVVARDIEQPCSRPGGAGSQTSL